MRIGTTVGAEEGARGGEGDNGRRARDSIVNGKILKSVVSLLLTFWLAYTVVFLLVRVVPGDPLTMLVGEQATAVDLSRLRAELGLDKSLWAQYTDRLVGLVSGHLGNSFLTGEPVSGMLLQRLPYTLVLTLLALFVAAIIAFPAGFVAGRNPGKTSDRSVSILATLGLAIPNFWLGPLLILLFSLEWGVFPTSYDGSLSGWVLPAVTLGTSLAALLMRVIRAEYVRMSQADHVRTAVAKGLPRRVIERRHIGRNLAVPVVTILGLQAGALLAGSVVTENIFAVPGLGQLLVDAINQRDYPAIEGCAMWIALVYILLNVALDGVYLILDPKQRSTG